MVIMRKCRCYSILTSVLSIYSLDSLGKDWAASYANPPGCFYSGPDVSGGRGWSSELQPDHHSWFLTNCIHAIWIKKKTWRQIPNSFTSVLIREILSNIIRHTHHCVVVKQGQSQDKLYYSRGAVCLAASSKSPPHPTNSQEHRITYKNWKS